MCRLLIPPGYCRHPVTETIGNAQVSLAHLPNLACSAHFVYNEVKRGWFVKKLLFHHPPVALSAVRFLSTSN